MAAIKRKRNKLTEKTDVNCSVCGLGLKHVSVRSHLRTKHGRTYTKDDVPYHIDGVLYAGPVHKKRKLNNQTQPARITDHPTSVSVPQRHNVQSEPISFELPPSLSPVPTDTILHHASVPSPSLRVRQQVIPPVPTYNVLPHVSAPLASLHVHQQQAFRRTTAPIGSKRAMKEQPSSNSSKPIDDGGIVSKILNGVRSLLCDQLAAGFASLATQISRTIRSLVFQFNTALNEIREELDDLKSGHESLREHVMTHKHRGDCHPFG